MAASRKLQGEIDRVLKKVQEGVELFDNIWNKSRRSPRPQPPQYLEEGMVYDTDNVNQKEKYEAELKKEIKKLQRYRDQIKTWIQSSEIKDKKALMDARKQIEREMERFKICEKETKTKAFSKEGLGQQPKTDPKEKAKSETRDWINTVVSELESQVDAFEAEIEGLTVKKGKTRPPRLTHLESSITRHKAHIMKLELILRLLENEELSPEQVNDVKDFLDDYVERNQDDFDEFSDVDELYSSLPLEKVEALEDLVAIGPPSHVKGTKPQPVVSASSSVLKTSAVSSSQTTGVVSPPLQSASQPEQIEELASVDNNSDVATRTPKSSVVSSSTLTSPVGSHTNSITVNVTANVAGTPIASTASLSPVSARATLENAGPSVPAPLSISSLPTEDDALSFPGRRSSPALADTGVVGGPGISGQPATLSHGSSAAVPGNGITLGTVTMVPDATKRNVMGADEKVDSSGMVQSPVTSSLGVAAGRTFSPIAPGMQWRPGSSFQGSSETVQFRGRTEITPDQREKFLQRLQQVQQQGPGNLLGMQTLGSGNLSQYPGKQQNPLQLNSQSSALPSQVALGLGVRPPGLNTTTSASLQQQSAPIPPQAAQEGPLSSGPKDSDSGLASVEEQQHNPSDDAAAETAPVAVTKSLITDTDLKASFSKDLSTGSASGPMTESGPFQRDTDLSPKQASQSSHPSSLGVIGRRSVPDLGTIGDTLGSPVTSPGGANDQLYNYKMLESAFHKLPQPKDSERPRTYNPRHPAVAPPSYPQVQAPVVNNPAFWERIAYMNENPDILFFAFYYQQNTYQQYLAAKQLKKQAWRFHRKYNTWFQRHEEPEEATDDYEKGSYVYFDFHIGEDEKGWCQRIRQDFTFEYNFLEDELMA